MTWIEPFCLWEAQMSNCYDPEFIIEGLADISPMLLAIQANAGVENTYCWTVLLSGNSI